MRQRLLFLLPLAALAFPACSSPRKQGEEITYHSNGEKASQASYKDGKREGPWSVWNDRGELIEQGAYQDGKEVGIFRYYPSADRKPRSKLPIYYSGDFFGDPFPSYVGANLGFSLWRGRVRLGAGIGIRRANQIGLNLGPALKFIPFPEARLSPVVGTSYVYALRERAECCACNDHAWIPGIDLGGQLRVTQGAALALGVNGGLDGATDFLPYFRVVLEAF